jgi:hypothetical protein
MERFFFSIELKSFEFIIEPIVQVKNSGKRDGYLCSIFLGRDGAFRLIPTVDAVATVDNSASFICKFRAITTLK